MISVDGTDKTDDVDEGGISEKDVGKNTWIGKAVDIQEDVLPGIKGMSLSKVRQKSPEKAIEMAKYVYKDIIEISNTDQLFNEFLRKIELFKEEDRPNAIGVYFECCDTFGHTTPFKAEDIERIMRYWSLKEDNIQLMIDTLVKA